METKKPLIVPGKEGAKIAAGIIKRIEQKRRIIQLLLSDEFDEPISNFYNIADKIARRLEWEEAQEAHAVKHKQLSEAKE